MATDKPEIININPYNCEIRKTAKGFVWEFSSYGPKSKRRKVVRIHFENYWFKYLAADLWQIIQGKRKEVNDMADTLINEPEED